MMPALLRYFSDLIHFKTSNPNPIPLHGNPILDNFVFKHAAVADDGFCRADIVLSQHSKTLFMPSFLHSCSASEIIAVA